MMILVAILAILSATVYLYFKNAFQYWKNRNVPYIEPSIPTGNMTIFSRRLQIGDQNKIFYDEFKKRGAKHGGVYIFAAPMYMPIDLDLLKTMLVKDAAYFLDRGLYYNEKDDPLSAHLFALGGTKWRNLRIKSTPAFTSGRMKLMFNILLQCSELLTSHMNKAANTDEGVDIKEELQRFTIDVIGSCAFGLECDSFQDAESPFRKYSKEVFVQKGINRLLQTAAVAFPKLAAFFGLKVIPPESAEFFMNICERTVKYREENNVSRNDFLQILIDLKNNKLDHEITEEHDGKSLTMNELAAQCLVFFIAGFETSSTLMTFALLELAKNQNIQDKLREEITTVLKKHNGELTYDCITEMKYLQQVLDESLRLYPPVAAVPRRSVKKYKVPGTNATIGKGVFFAIPVLAIHRDEEYYPNPLVFDPERFSEENKKKRHPFAFIPFGEGPRICIGMRFGLMQSKVGLITLLKDFKFTLDERTNLPIQFSPDSLVTTALGGIWLKAEKVSV